MVKNHLPSISQKRKKWYKNVTRPLVMKEMQNESMVDAILNSLGWQNKTLKIPEGGKDET